MKCQTVIAGIGGQGVLFAAKILTEIARRREVPVLGSQTFGMAQRGGSVTTHLKMGEFESPLICEGDAFSVPIANGILVIAAGPGGDKLQLANQATRRRFRE